MDNTGESESGRAFQQSQGLGMTSSIPLRRGEIHASGEFITCEQLDDALPRQRSSGKNQGEVLVDEKYVRPYQTHDLNVQQKLLFAGLAAIVSLAGVSAAPVFAGMTAGKKIMVTSTVVSRAVLKVISQPQELVVTTADISRGYVEVNSAVRLEVKNNSRAGYLLVFELPGMLFREMHVQGLGTEVRISHAGGWIQRPYTPETSALELSLKFILTEDLRPGTYEWPLALSVRPL